VDDKPADDNLTLPRVPSTGPERFGLPIADGIVGGIFYLHAQAHGAEMLDNFIIERIRRERERRESGRIPLRIEDANPLHRRPQPQKQKPDNHDERGVAIIDFTI
jgi:hypothetical protein